MTIRNKILLKIAVPIILAGLFVIIVFLALNYENISLEIYGIFVLVAIFVFLFGFATGQKFSLPIRQLLERVNNLSRGDLNSRVYFETKDEFEELGRAFNKIAEELEKSHQETAQAEGITDVKVRAKTQELEETIDNLEQKVKNRAQELQDMVTESERLQGLAKNREVEVMNLKKEIKEMRDLVAKKKK